ncbi:MAG: tetratricopeptide repeat protein [Aphanizomenon sp.]
MNPNYADAYYNRGIVRNDLGDKQGAIDDYTLAIKINPNDAQA